MRDFRIISIGRVHWRGFRDYLKKMQFIGHEIEWIESSGWISRDFVIKGPTRAIRFIDRDLCRWITDCSDAI